MRKNLFLTADALDLNWFLRPYFTLIGGIFSIFLALEVPKLRVRKMPLSKVAFSRLSY